MSDYKYRARCNKCAMDFAKPPRNWDCPRCSSKTWQPDDAVTSCQVCDSVVARFTRHHCRSCGLVTCTTCTSCTTFIPEWSTSEKQRVCKRCAVPDVPPSMAGYLQKLGQRNAFFGEKFQSRFFELRGANLIYSKEQGGPSFGQVDIEGAKIIEVAIHPNAFCLIGPKLQRGYVFSADSLEMKRKWVTAINSVIAIGAKDKPEGASEDDVTQSILYSGVDDNQTICMADFEVQTVLGLGSFGRVMKVKQKKSGKIFAMKVLDKRQIINSKMITHTQAEKSILSEINHPFIVALHYAFQTKRHLVLVLDFLSGGEVFFHLQRNKRFSENRSKFYAAEIGLALEYIRGKNIIYRDLKPENLVLDRKGHVTLTDFGLAKKDVSDVTHTFCGTPEYMAPELILKKGHTFAVDWWSLGIFLYEMVSGMPPFYTQNVTEMYDLILHRPLQCPSYFSPNLQSLLHRLLDRDPAKRMQTGTEFRAHPFFKDINFEKLYKKEIKPEFVPDVSSNDVRYFDKQFLQETTNIAQLELPNDPNDPASKRFEGFDYAHNAGTKPSAGADVDNRISKK